MQSAVYVSGENVYGLMKAALKRGGVTYLIAPCIDGGGVGRLRHKDKLLANCRHGSSNHQMWHIFEQDFPLRSLVEVCNTDSELPLPLCIKRTFAAVVRRKRQATSAYVCQDDRNDIVCGERRSRMPFAKAEVLDNREGDHFSCQDHL